MVVEFDRDPSIYPDGNIVEVTPSSSYPWIYLITVRSGEALARMRTRMDSRSSGVGTSPSLHVSSFTLNALRSDTSSLSR